MGLLTGKTILVSGVLTTSSIAFHTARTAQEQGARVVLTGHGRMRLIERIAQRLPQPPPLLELDVTDPEHLASLPDRLREHVARIDGVVHSIAFAPESVLGGNFMTAEWPEVAEALQVSTYSMQALARAALPLMTGGGAVVGLDFDAARSYAGYDWMGVAKAGLESCTRYLASYLGSSGIRANLVAAGPLRTTAARAVGVGGADPAQDGADPRGTAPLGWDERDCEPVAKACVALLSDWFPATTGEIVHVDGGAHSVGDRPGALPAAAGAPAPEESS